MLIDWSKVQIFVKPGITDMRKQINGLSLIVSEELQGDLFSGNLFLFCNKNRRLIKILYWDRNGFSLWTKRLEKDKFPWSKDYREVKEISFEQFGQLLNGIDFWLAHKEIKYSHVS